MATSSIGNVRRGLDLTHNLLLPTLLFAALGAMSWAVRGCSGFGGSAGCIFAGVLWGIAWWFVARDGTTAHAEHDNWAWPARRYRNAMMHLGLYLGFLLYEVLRRDWKNVLLITTVGVVNGAGWAALQNWKWHDDVWPGATFNWWRCWESSGGISIGIAYGVAFFLVNRPMGAAERAMIRARRSLNWPTIEWLAVYLGLTALLVLPVREEAHWSIQAFLATVALFGVAYYLLRRNDLPRRDEPALRANGDANLERFGLGLGLLVGLGFSVRNGLKGFFNMHYGNEEYYATLLWQIVGPSLVVGLLVLCAWIFWRPLPKNFAGDAFRYATPIVWLALVWQNVLGQLVTGPLSEWPEFAFAAYYVLLFLITAVIVIHFSDRARQSARG